MYSKEQLDRLIKNVPGQFDESNVRELKAISKWDEESCRWFIWHLKMGLKTSLIGYTSAKYDVFYMPDLGEMFGVTRFAPMGSKKQIKNLEKLMHERGKFNVDDQYEDVAKNYIDYITITTVTYMTQGNQELFAGLTYKKTFIAVLQGFTNMLFTEGGDGKEEEDEQIWDPYSLQDFILKKMIASNQEIEKENKENKDKESDDGPKELLIIPDDFDIVKDREKISPI